MLATACALVMGLVEQGEVRIDPRVELVTTVFRLAGAGEFCGEAGGSAYIKKVDGYFAPFKNHPAVEMARRVRQESQIGFDAVTTLAVNLTDVHSLGERIPFDLPPARWDSRWKAKDARDFVGALRAFVRDTHYEEFLAAEAPYFSKATTGLSGLLKTYDVNGWTQKFYGTRPSHEPFAIVGLLCGGGNYGMSVQYPDGSIEMSPIFGASDFDSEGVPAYGVSSLSTVVHEFSHAYVNVLVRPSVKELAPSVQRFWPRVGPMLRANAYGSDDAVLYETFVRAVESYIVRQRLSLELADRSMVVQRAKGFLWTSDLADELKAYEADRKRYPTFADFLPRLEKKFEGLARRPERLYARCPKVSDCRFVPGAVEGEQQVVAIQVRFDRPMRDQAWGVNIEPAGWTEVEKSRFVDDRTLSLTIKVKRGVSYDFGLDRFGGGFVSREGYPVLPYAKGFKVG